MVVSFTKADVASAPNWKPRPPLKMLDLDEAVRQPEIVPLGAGNLVLDADGEAPLVLATSTLDLAGRWVAQAVIVLAGAELANRAAAMLDHHAPRLIALAGDEAEVDAAFTELRDRLDGTGLVALERALAVEV